MSTAGKSEHLEQDTRCVMTAIRQIVRVLRESSRAAEKSIGVSGAQLFVLQRLAGEPGLSLNELALRTHTHQSSVSVVVARLVDRGLVERTRAADDARRLELKLTSKGKDVLSKAPGAAQDRLIDGVRRLPGTQRKSLSESLGELVRTLGVRDAEPPMLFEEDAGKAPRKPKNGHGKAQPAKKRRGC